MTHSLKSPLCSCVSTTLPARHHKRESQHHVKAAMHRVADCITDRIWLAIPQPTEWQRIGNQIDAAFIFARADFVKLHRKPKEPSA